MSWKTSLFGFIAAIGAAVMAALQTGIIEPGSLPVWVKGLAGLATVIGTAGAGFAARDNDKTSEDVQAGGKPNGRLVVMGILFLVGAAAAGMLLSGCGYLRSTTVRSTNPDTKTVTEKTSVRAVTFWDSHNDLAKFKNSPASGTSISGMDQSSSSTNVNEVLSTVAGAVVGAAIKAAK